MTNDERLDPALWPHPEPDDGFLDRVMSAIDDDERRRRRRRAAGSALVTSLLAAAAAFAFFARPAGPASGSGEITAEARSEVEIAPGARAVVERYAHLVWRAGAVVQDRGDVFYRLSPGVHLDVRTPAGAVASEGACSRVKVLPPEPGTSPAVLVSVAQGSVSITGAPGRVVLAAGRYARFDSDRIRTDEDDADGAIAYSLAHDRARAYAEARRPQEPAPAPTVAARPLQPSPPRPPGAPAQLPSSALALPPPPSAARAASSAKPTFHRPHCECDPSDSLCACWD